MRFLYRLKQLIILSGDLLSYLLGFYLALVLRGWNIPNIERVSKHINMFIILTLIWVVINYISGLYDIGYISQKNRKSRRAVETAFLAFVAGIIYLYLRPNTDVTPKTILAIGIALGFIISSLWRWLALHIINIKTLQKAVLFIGYSPEITELLPQLHTKSYCPKAILDQQDISVKDKNIELFHTIKSIRSIVNTYNIKTVVIAEHMQKDPDVIKEVYELLFWSVHIYSLSEFYEEMTGRVPPCTFSESWFLSHLKSTENPVYNKWRNLLDILTIIFVGAWFLCILPFVALAIRLTSPGPIFFTQKRTGLGNKTFHLYKFRSMYALAKDGSAEVNGYQFAKKNDDRITPVGRFLRKTRIDELPQILNLIKGDISLIGPRPERPEIVQNLTEHMPYYPLRHVIKPGLTGWAVLHQNYTDTIETSLQKLQYDLYYIKNKSILVDVSIMLKTINLILRGMGQ
ncbi:sugar transferase [Patescibacteria group bacterium]|nr:sugar transferase [Patescibacteria group bacterium]MBU1722039.1 sugar transferase [Patescibacteria group bacterium]MBU1901758.1 sugar transferase [Patescibacteria group bacterium]